MDAVDGAASRAKMFEACDAGYVLVVRSPLCKGDRLQDGIRVRASAERHLDLNQFFLANVRGLEARGATIVERSPDGEDRQFRRVRARSLGETAACPHLQQRKGRARAGGIRSDL